MKGVDRRSDRRDATTGQGRGELIGEHRLPGAVNAVHGNKPHVGDRMDLGRDVLQQVGASRGRCHGGMITQSRRPVSLRSTME